MRRQALRTAAATLFVTCGSLCPHPTRARPLIARSILATRVKLAERRENPVTTVTRWIAAAARTRSPQATADGRRARCTPKDAAILGDVGHDERVRCPPDARSIAHAKPAPHCAHLRRLCPICRQIEHFTTHRTIGLGCHRVTPHGPVWNKGSPHARRRAWYFFPQATTALP